jgi:hypothetical protein
MTAAKQGETASQPGHIRIGEALAVMLSECLSCGQASWSIGEYGAVAEFHHADEVPAQVQGLGLVA